MNTLKYCCGYKGDWGCGESDHMLSLDEFSDDKYSKDGKQPMCKKCRVGMDAIRWTKRPKHPVTGEGKSNWKQRIAKNLGGSPDAPGWQGYLDKAEVIWNDEVQDIEAKAWLGTIFPRPPKDNLPRSKPARKRVSTTYDRLLPKEGWVYIMDTYRYNKIGKTWEDGLRARRSEARRWGPADLVYWAWFDDAMAAEKEIHRRLKRYRVEKENVGEELFNCPVSIARDEIKKLQKELEDDTRKEQKVG
tara:strand:+ start:644 stop:1381 length:738 start_codon:yes stop_codon:yes gene_type:complete